nr:MAG TPA: hypothetical protein [Caudoviricetes sp.]
MELTLKEGCCSPLKRATEAVGTTSTHESSKMIFHYNTEL